MKSISSMAKKIISVVMLVLAIIVACDLLGFSDSYTFHMRKNQFGVIMNKDQRLMDNCNAEAS